MSRTVAIVQARLGSRRLPGKVLADLEGKPMLARQFERLARCKTLDQLLLATTTEPSDEPVAALASSLGLATYRGSLDDVLDRYYQAAKAARAGTVVRITADCPLIDPVVSDDTVRLYRSGGLDYASTGSLYPDGLDTEVFSFQALETAWREARLASEREHVTPFIYKNPDRFRIKTMTPERDLSAQRWTVDEPADLEFVRQVYRRLYRPGGVFLMKDVLELLEREPGLRALNEGIGRNEGYAKSLAEDRVVKED